MFKYAEMVVLGLVNNLTGRKCNSAKEEDNVFLDCWLDLSHFIQE